MPSTPAMNGGEGCRAAICPATTIKSDGFNGAATTSATSSPARIGELLDDRDATKGMNDCCTHAASFLRD